MYQISNYLESTVRFSVLRQSEINLRMNLYIYVKSNALSCLTSILLTFVVNHQMKQKQLNISLEVILLFAIKEMHSDFLLLCLEPKKVPKD